MNYARWLISKIVLDSFVNISFLRCRENIDEFMKTCFNTESKPGENIGFVHSLRAVQYTEFAWTSIFFPNLDDFNILALALELLERVCVWFAVNATI